MTRRILCILLVAMLHSAGCSKTDSYQGDIQHVLTIRADALNARNISAYVSVISPQYNDKGKSFVQLKEDLEKNFREFEQISYEADRPTITVNGSTADSTSSYRMKIKVRGKEIMLNGTEHLRLTKEAEGWKIVAGI